MRIFELVKSVLDENYSKIQGTEKERDNRIRKQLSELTKGYSALASANGVTYEKPLTRFAYIYASSAESVGGLRFG